MHPIHPTVGRVAPLSTTLSCQQVAISAVMPDLRRSRTETSTQRPRTRSRSQPRSRPGSRSAPLHRLLSNQFPDDHSVYHHEEGEGLHVKTDAESLHKTETERRTVESTDSDSDSTTDGGDEKDDTVSTERRESTVEEIRGGIPYEHDIEEGGADSSTLEKKKSSKSLRDPNLVGFPKRSCFTSNTPGCCPICISCHNSFGC